jgi:hypothetical protein
MSQNSTISKMETTQTAVDWFYQRILAKDIKEVYEQAKQMEKEQIMNAWLNGDNDSMYEPSELVKQSEQYYNETYGSNNQI